MLFSDGKMKITGPSLRHFSHRLNLRNGKNNSPLQGPSGYKRGSSPHRAVLLGGS
jgi:hypothetical protein